jgi:hypothetical protein
VVADEAERGAERGYPEYVRHRANLADGEVAVLELHAPDRSEVDADAEEGRRHDEDQPGPVGADDLPARRERGQAGGARDLVRDLVGPASEAGPVGRAEAGHADYVALAGVCAVLGGHGQLAAVEAHVGDVGQRDPLGGEDVPDHQRVRGQGGGLVQHPPGQEPPGRETQRERDPAGVRHLVRPERQRDVPGGQGDDGAEAKGQENAGSQGRAPGPRGGVAARLGDEHAGNRMGLCALLARVLDGGSAVLF